MQVLKQSDACKRSIVLKDLFVLNPHVNESPSEQPMQLLIKDGKIVRIATSLSEDEVSAAIIIDCGGRIILPGLCDAHVHVTACSANLPSLLSLPESYVTARATVVLEGMLKRGFTTVRDCGGADFGLARAIEEGWISGPTLLYTGHALSTTGGHGDMRGMGEDHPCAVGACGAALRGIGRVVDGDTEVRRAARDELRKGAHCIKVMASGGVASPTDALTSTQFSLAELRAIVEEAEAAGTYATAHAYQPRAIKRALDCGVRAIEHGNWLDEGCATMMKEKGSFLVPTLVTYWALSEHGEAAGMKKELVQKVGDCLDRGLESLSVAHKAGMVRHICFGSDLLGDLHVYQSKEFELRSRVLPARDVLLSSTTNCAALFGQSANIGRLAQGFDADLVILEKGVDPSVDASVLARGEEAIWMVMKKGRVAATRSSNPYVQNV